MLVGSGYKQACEVRSPCCSVKIFHFLRWNAKEIVVFLAARAWRMHNTHNKPSSMLLVHVFLFLRVTVGPVLKQRVERFCAMAGFDRTLR